METNYQNCINQAILNPFVLNISTIFYGKTKKGNRIIIVYDKKRNFITKTILEGIVSFAN